MATRHRIPTIFNLSMVDVLCCALGCVILLWLFNLRDAKQRAEVAGEVNELLARTRSELSSSEQRVASLGTQLDTAAAERDRQLRRAASVEKVLADLKKQFETLEEQLAQKVKEQDETAKELAAARQRIVDLGQTVRHTEDLARKATDTAENLGRQLTDAESRLKQAQSQAQLVPGLRDEAQMVREKLAAAERDAAGLRQELDTRKQDLSSAARNVTTLEDNTRRLEREVAGLRDEKRALSDQAARARAAAENRFAGISLTGRRVVFLVDVSGSMELTDENTAAPDKWAEVRQTITRIMRSLPDLEKVQVILFSNQVRYLLGNEGRWLDYSAATTPGAVDEALAQIKPRGNTDMYAALDAAFRFRADGLDTIYLFSDGLPNMGMGLSPDAARAMTEIQRTDALGKHVRRTLLADWNRVIAGKPRVKVNAIGFFYESPDVGAFLWALTRENDGSFVGMSKP
jgi:predicted  nucleic acid-binding Zn-ribbon protein